jgi:hypothetical protein
MDLQINNVIPFMGGEPISLYVKDGKFVSGPGDLHLDMKGALALPSALALPGALSLDMKGALALPGLINSHDHLEFNCFRALGDRKHPDYVAWGKDIHGRYTAEIDAVLRIPGELRARWGVYKNLLGGVTTVLQHGHAWGLGACAPIRVVENIQSIHSVGLEPRWRLRLNHPLRWKEPCIIHIGEGVNEMAAREVRTLLHWNLLKRKLVGVHGMGVSPAQASRFQALVWCPVSNYFLYGDTAKVDELGSNTCLLFGTDSTLTGHWDIWEHMRAALESGMVSEVELLEALSCSPARVWSLHTGRLEPGFDADLVVLRPGVGLASLGSLAPDGSLAPGGGLAPGDDLASGGAAVEGRVLGQLSAADILLVLSRGNPVLADESVFPLLDQDGGGWSAVQLKGSVKYVRGNLPELMNQIHAFYPEMEFPVNPTPRIIP